METLSALERRAFPLQNIYHRLYPGPPVNVKHCLPYFAHDARCIMGKVGGDKKPKEGEYNLLKIKKNIT